MMIIGLLSSKIDAFNSKIVSSWKYNETDPKADY